LVGVLRAARVVPRVEVRVRQRLGGLVAADVRDRRQTLRVTAGRARIAARVTVEVEEERELDLHAVARAGRVPRAEAGVAARLVDVDRREAVRLRIRDLLADLGEDRRRAAAALGRRRGVGVARAERDAGADVGARGIGVLRVRAVVRRVAHAAV